MGGALTFVALVSGIFTFYQDNKSRKIMDSFAKMIPPKAKVLRNTIRGVGVGDLHLLPGEQVEQDNGVVRQDDSTQG